MTKQTASNNLFIRAAKLLFNTRVSSKVAALINAGDTAGARALAKTFGCEFPEAAIYRQPFALLYRTHQTPANLAPLLAHAERYVKALRNADPLVSVYEDSLRQAVRRDAKCQAVFHSSN